MTYKSAAENREEAVRVLGEDLGQLYHHLKQDTYRLLLDWRIYKGLFGTNEQRVQLLNKASGLLAHTIEGALQERILLRLCRLNDPAEQNGNRNITIRALPPLIDESLRDEIESLVEQAGSVCQPIRKLRSKSLAHSDWTQREKANGIFGTSRREIGRATDSVSAVIRWVAREMMHVELELEAMVLPPSDEVAFLQLVYDGIAARESREEERLDARKRNEWKSLKNLEPKYPNWLKR